MKKKHKIIVLLLVMASLIAVIFPVAAEDATLPPYYYYFNVINDGTDKGGKVILDLYILHGEMSQPNMDGGSFGLRFPKRLTSDKVKFEAINTNIEVTPIVGIDRAPSGNLEIVKDGYYAFSWVTKPGADYANKTLDPEPVKGHRMRIGTFTLEIGEALPSKSSVGVLDWLKVAEAIPAEPTESNPNKNPELDPFNSFIWSKSDKAYQGYFMPKDNTGASNAEDADLVQHSIPLRWTVPAAWPNDFLILSYDPKKVTSLQLFEEDGTTPISDVIDLEQWDTSGKKDTATLFAATANNKDKGSGAYFLAGDLDKFVLTTDEISNPVTAVAEKKYVLRVFKAGHVTANIKLTATSTSFNDCTGMPTDGDALYLLCGDVNPVAQAESKVTYGDGKIRLNDRALLAAYINGGMSAKNALQETVNGALNPCYFADLDGDGAITLIDMSILMSDLNFGK